MSENQIVSSSLGSGNIIDKTRFLVVVLEKEFMQNLE